MYAYRLSLKKDVIRYKSEASQRSVKRRRIEYLIFLRLRLDLFDFFYNHFHLIWFPQGKTISTLERKDGKQHYF